MKKIEKLFQIAIASEPVCTENWSLKLKSNVASLKSYYPDATYYLYENSDIRKFLSKNFDRKVLETYDQLQPFAFKADLARYCLLYFYGGLYSDLSYLHVNAIKPETNCGMVIFRDIAGHPSWAVSNAIIFSEPGRSELKYAIDMIIENADKKYYGNSPLDVSGPYLFGRACSIVNKPEDVVFGDSVELTPNSITNRNICKILPNGEFIAYRNKKEGGQILAHGVSGTNNYCEMWNHRQVWA